MEAAVGMGELFPGRLVIGVMMVIKEVAYE
jgi:hypothetical protein